MVCRESASHGLAGALKLAILSGITQMDMTHLARQKFEKARQVFGGDQAELLVCKLIEEASDVDLRVPGDWPKHGSQGVSVMHQKA